MITTVMAGISVCQIVPIEAEESTYTASVEEDTGTLQVEASAPDDVLPKDAQLVVSPIVNDGTNSLYEDTLNKLNEQASKDKKVIDAFCAYDIQFEDKDAGVEPDDGFVSVSMKWDTTLKPEGVQDDDKVSIVHLTSDDKIENLTDETDTDKNHGTVKMDDNDPEAVTEASIMSNSFSVYALVWQRDDISSVNVHYIDESGNEIATTNTTDITQETGTDSLVQSIDGYTYAYASIDNVNVQSVNIENGRLYFYDGTNWNQASSDDLYLTYTVNPTEEATEPESTPEVTEQPEETEAPVTPVATTEPEQNTDKQLTGSTTDGKYNVTVTYGDDAGLPEGTTLSVKQIDEDNEEYANAKKAVSTATGVDTNDLGMAALDITLLDKDGNKVEPEDNSKVKVSITAADLPDDINVADLYHIVDSTNKSSGNTVSNGIVRSIRRAARIFNNEIAVDTQKTAESVDESVPVNNGRIETSFTTSSFSTFTIVWKKSGSDNTTIGRVTLHYVDVNGLEINRTATLDTTELEKTDGAPVKISDWVDNATDGTRKVSGYIFDRATLEGINGKEITGVKVAHDSNDASKFKLYYTTADDPTASSGVTWTEYTDSVSKENANNADIYLVFSSTAQRMRIHFVDDSGNIIMNPVYKYADQTYTNYSTNGFDITNTDVATNPWAEAIQDYTYSGIAQVGEEGKGWQGFRISTVRAYTTGTDTGDDHIIYRYEYKLTPSDSDDDWVNMTGTDIYLIYQKTSTIAHQLSVHYVDEDGKDLLTTDPKTVTKSAQDVFDAAKNNENQAAIDISTWATEKTFEGYSFVRARLGTTTAQGTAFKQIRAQKDSDTSYKFQYKLNSDSSNAWTNVTATDVYLIYRKSEYTKPITIHYVEKNTGAAVLDETGDVLNKVVEGTQWNNWMDYKQLSPSISGYTLATSDTMYMVNKNSATLSLSDRRGANQTAQPPTVNNYSTGIISGTGFLTRFIKYTSDGFRIGDGAYNNNGTINCNREWLVNGGDITDIYIPYTKNSSSSTENYTYTVHYIDEKGNVIDTATPKTTIALSSGNDSVTVNVSSLAKTISGYTANTSGLLGRATEESGGIPLTSITFTPRDGGGWNYSVTSENSKSPKPRQLVLHNLHIYVVYERSDSLRIHFVDEKGNVLDDSIVRKQYETFSRNYYIASGHYYALARSGSYGMGYALPSSGYTFKEIRVDSFSEPVITHSVNQNFVENGRSNPGGEFRVTYSGSGTSLTSTYQENGQNSTATATAAPIQDLYFVFQKNVSNVKVHYVYVAGRVSADDNALKMSKISGSDGEDKTIETFPSSAGTAIDLAGKNATQEPNYAPNTIGNYSYAGTRVGPAWSDSLTYSDLGTNVSSVYEDNGQLIYYGDTTVPLTYLRNNTWYHAENNGRRFELSRSGTDNQYNYELNDSRHGTVSLNESSTDSTNNSVTYIATFHGEAQTTEYKLTYYPSNPSSTRYSLTVSDWTPNSQMDVYEIYVDSSKYSLWIEDDQMYSGYLIANKIEGIPNNGTYSWYKTVKDSDGNTSTDLVLRKQTGEHYNIEYDPRNRTWLDVEADDGGLNSTTQTEVSYYVTYTYTDSSGQQQTIQSNTINIEYYSELKNGSFNDVPSPADKIPTWQPSNKEYKQKGIWQTTGVGTGSKNGNDIEIVNNTKNLDGYSWNGSTDTVDGDHQFAELNCEASGALYQDVVTHPNQQLHYWLSHRARGSNKNAVPEYDTMYLVIMPTKLAMTSGANGGELTTQDELIDFINNHGGYDTSLATGVGQEVTHEEDDDGVLIVKISSNDQFWHTVRSINGYTARAGLTRFFFAAGPTASGNPTVGNFIDAVGFSQDPPSTNGFNLSVSKTFTGLEDSDLAALAKQVVDANGNATETREKPFNITITDQFAAENALTDDGALTALNGAQLGFNVSGTNGNYVFTPTATLNGSNILTGNSSGTVRRNQDGSITMTWDFLDVSMTDNKGNVASGNNIRFYYTVREENAGVGGKYLTSSESHSNTDKDKHRTSGSGGSEYIHQGDSAVFTLNNTYSDSSASEQPQMIITKTFSGMTPTAVDAMLPGYTLKVQKTDTGADDSDFITLTSNKQNTIKSTEGVTDATSKGVTATVEEIPNDDSTTTLRWTIKGWGAGTYTITEEGYDTSTNKLKTVTINGSSEGVTDSTREGTVTTVKEDGTTETTTQTIAGKQKSGITVGTALENVQYDETSKSEGGTDNVSLTGSAENQPKKNTNLIIAQYTLSTEGGGKRFLVWTPEALSANVSQAIVDKINSVWSLTGNNAATINNTQFHSSENPGSMNVGTGGSGTISYDSEAQNLTFTGSDTLTWNRYYSTRYWVGVSSTDSGKYSDTDIAVKNSYLPAIRVLKVDSNNTSTPLAGAKFKLFKMSGNDDAATRQYLKVSGTTLSWNSDSNGATELETNDQGFAVHNESGATALEIISQLQPGTYYIEESKAPDGYNQLSHPVAFTVSDDGIVTKPQATDNKIGNVTVDQDKIVSLDWNSPYYTITISNTPGFILPITGGKGIALLTMMGMLLIAIAGVLYAKKKVNQNIKNLQS